MNDCPAIASKSDTFNYKVVRQFALMTVVWGIVGMAVGVFLAAQLIWPQLNFDTAWLSYGRLRPLHTNAVIFAFGGSALFATSYYVVQRTCQARLFCDKLAAFTFWGWQVVIVAAAITLPMGFTSSKEYAELEWPIDILISLILLAPSWGGMINGIMTLQGAWYKLRTDPILKFMVTALSFYGMSTFEGSMMSIRTVNALSHYTDWTIGHVHSGALGWVAMISFGSLYYLIPRLYGREKMYSTKAIELHFWIATIGVVLYIAAMWIAGVQQGLMWRDTAPDGTLVYSFVEELKTRVPYYLIRLLGGTLFLCGVFVMAWNVLKTVTGATAVDPAIPQDDHHAARPPVPATAVPATV